METLTRAEAIAVGTGGLVALLSLAGTVALGLGYEVREGWLLVVLPLLVVAGLVASLSILLWDLHRLSAHTAAFLLGGLALVVVFALLVPGQEPGSADGAWARRGQVALGLLLAGGPLAVAWLAAKHRRAVGFGLAGLLLTLGLTVWALVDAFRKPSEAAGWVILQLLGSLSFVYLLATIAAWRSAVRRHRKAAVP